MQKSPLYKLTYKVLYKARDIKNARMFPILKKYVQGNVLDVGGDAFFQSAVDHGFSFKNWTSVEPTPVDFSTNDRRYRFVQADGCNMPFKNNTFDTIINTHVLEHVYEPNKMVTEIARVMKPGGTAVFLIPCSANLHMAPGHYYNFTQFWIRYVMKENKLKIVLLEPVGGLWASTALRMSYFFLIALRFKGMSSDFNKRTIWFYILFPFMVAFLPVLIVCSMIFSLGDLTENPNDHLVVVKKQK